MTRKALTALVSTPLIVAVSAFCSLSRPDCHSSGRSGPKNNYLRQISQPTPIFATYDDSDTKGSSFSSSYESSASVTKGLVSTLTSLTNNIFGGNISRENETSTNMPPTSPEELLQRIQKEYTQNNYLWTGNIDTSSFVSNCTFKDPTLSFVGVDDYVKNVGKYI